MEHFSNGAILKWSDSQMERFSNGAILKWSNSQMERFGVATLCHISRSQEQRNMACDVLTCRVLNQNHLCTRGESVPTFIKRSSLNVRIIEIISINAGVAQSPRSTGLGLVARFPRLLLRPLTILASILGRVASS